MDYESARYFTQAMYTEASHEIACNYVDGAADVFGDSLKLKGFSYTGGLNISTYRARKYVARKSLDLLKRAEGEPAKELGLYFYSPDYAKNSAPSFLSNIHFSFQGTIAGKTIRENPTAFCIIGVRTDHAKIEPLKRYLVHGRPKLHAGGHWQRRKFVLNGTSLEWAHRNYPIPRRACSLEDWCPEFDVWYE